jgi:hypothetical protein
MAKLGALFNHLVLPPQIPGKQDEDPESLEHALLARLVRACDFFCSIEYDLSEIWVDLRNSILAWSKIHKGHIDKEELLTQFSVLQCKHPLLLYVREQNASLIIRRKQMLVDPLGMIFSLTSLGTLKIWLFLKHSRFLLHPRLS